MPIFGQRRRLQRESRRPRLVAEAIEDREDTEAERKLAADHEGFIPAEFVNRVIDGESRVRVRRDYRDMTERDLATRTDLNAPYISEIESRKKEAVSLP